jgi:hypothetical protein
MPGGATRLAPGQGKQQMAEMLLPPNTWCNEGHRPSAGGRSDIVDQRFMAPPRPTVFLRAEVKISPA